MAPCDTARRTRTRIFSHLAAENTWEPWSCLRLTCRLSFPLRVLPWRGRFRCWVPLPPVALALALLASEAQKLEARLEQAGAMAFVTSQLLQLFLRRIGELSPVDDSPPEVMTIRSLSFSRSRQGLSSIECRSSHFVGRTEQPTQGHHCPCSCWPDSGQDVLLQLYGTVVLPQHKC